MIEELLRVVKVNENIKYEVYDGGDGKYIVVSYFNGEVMGQSQPLMKHEIINYLKNSDLYIEE
jgi:hypothetical protein